MLHVLVAQIHKRLAGREVQPLPLFLIRDNGALIGALCPLGFTHRLRMRPHLRRALAFHIALEFHRCLQDPASSRHGDHPSRVWLWHSQCSQYADKKNIVPCPDSASHSGTIALPSSVAEVHITRKWPGSGVARRCGVARPTTLSAVVLRYRAGDGTLVEATGAPIAAPD